MVLPFDEAVQPDRRRRGIACCTRTNYRWLVEYNFSQQDMSVMENQRYDWPEKLSGTDAEVVQWRRLVVTKRFGGRDAEFDHRLPEALDAD